MLSRRFLGLGRGVKWRTKLSWAHSLDLAAFAPRLGFGLLGATATWLVAYDYGTLLISTIEFRHWAARSAVASALGYALLGSVAALLGLAGALSPLALWILLAVAIVARMPAHVRRVRAMLSGAYRLRRALARWDGVSWCAAAAGLFALITACVSAALPTVWWDPLAYHLPLVSAALIHGRFAFDPQMVQSGFPLLGEAAALPAYAIGGSAGAAMATFGAGIFLALGARSIADGLAEGTGPLAAALVVCSALWLWLAPSFYVDVTLALFVIAAVVVAIGLGKGRATPLAGAIVCGMLCGAAAATKYSGLATSIAVLALALWSTEAVGRWKTLIGFACGFFAIAAGWYARTYLLTGDPIYPFLSSVLGRSPEIREFATRYVFMTQHWCGGGMSFADAMTLPYRLLVEPATFCGDPGYALRLGIIFAVAAVLMIRVSWPIASTAALFTFFWFVGSQQWRFALPALCLYAVLVAAGTAAAGARVRIFGAYVLVALCAIGVLVNWLPSTERAASSSIAPAFGYLAGAQSAEAYLDLRLESMAAARWCSEHDIPGSQIIALDDVRNYYFPQGTTWANPYYQQTWNLNWSVSAHERYGAIRARGFRYMVVNENPAYVHRTPTGVDWAALMLDRTHGLRLLFSSNGVSVYDLSAIP